MRARFFIDYDHVQPLNKAWLTLERRMGSDFPVWKLRLEFSPSKAGPEGLVKLTSGLAAVLPFINLKRLLKAFRMARVDAAIDCIGATPLDLIAHIPKPGKRMVFVGDHGRPESVYFYQKKAALKAPPAKLGVRTTGPHRLTLYERRDYCLQLKLQPPYGPCPVTRAEVTKRWTAKRPFLSELSDIKSLFEGRRVAYAAGVETSDPKTWRQFCLAAFGGGADKSLFSWLPGPGGKFAKLYANCQGYLIDPSCWERWVDGIKHTGLPEWIKQSENLSA